MTGARLSSFYLAVMPIFVVAALAGVAIGTTRMPLATVVDALAHHLLWRAPHDAQAVTRVEDTIVWLVRAPRANHGCARGRAGDSGVRQILGTCLRER